MCTKVKRKRTRQIISLAAIWWPLCLLPAAQNAAAAQQYCDGTVTNLFVRDDGEAIVRTSWRSDYVAVCNVNQVVGKVTPTQCLTWLSFLKSAVERKSRITFFYADAPVCSVMPTYGGAPTPGYVMLMD